MILRYFRRVYRLYGIRPFGLLIIVLLFVLLGLDQYGTEYSEAADNRDELARQELDMRNKIGQQARIERSLQDSHAALSADARVVQGVTVERSTTEFVATVTKKLSSASVARPKVTVLPSRIRNEKGTFVEKSVESVQDNLKDAKDKGGKPNSKDGKDIKGGDKGSLGAEIAAEIEFAATTRQLVTLLQSFRNGTPAIRVASLEVRVANAEAPREVEVKARVEAAYVPAGIAAPDPLSKSARPGARRATGAPAR
ncbi:MAG: hypothetical protein FWD77_11235 [Betaproteobacteria bacterium]|nr:hypothetical protein [Betaproteobacteria bacterium]